jgi:hypothetical protein
MDGGHPADGHSPVGPLAHLRQLGDSLQSDHETWPDFPVAQLKNEVGATCEQSRVARVRGKKIANLSGGGGGDVLEMRQSQMVAQWFPKSAMYNDDPKNVSGGTGNDIPLCRFLILP